MSEAARLWIWLYLYLPGRRLLVDLHRAKNEGYLRAGFNYEILKSDFEFSTKETIKMFFHWSTMTTGGAEVQNSLFDPRAPNAVIIFRVGSRVFFWIIWRRLHVLKCV